MWLDNQYYSRRSDVDPNPPPALNPVGRLRLEYVTHETMHATSDDLVTVANMQIYDLMADAYAAGQWRDGNPALPVRGPTLNRLADLSRYP
eukprot:scaffold4688_cov24-Prasinocladus_malaysianus.AAC.1